MEQHIPTDDPGGQGWTVGPPPARVSRGGAVFTLIALIAGFVGGIAAGFALDDGPEVDSVASIGASDGDGTQPGTEGTGAWLASGHGSDASVAVAGDSSMAPFERTRLFRRESVSGYSVRVFRTDHGRPEQRCGGGGWCPPPECYPTASVEAAVVGEWTVSQGGGPLYPLRDGEAARVLGAVASWDSQDEPVVGFIVRTADGVQSVRLTAGGVTDEMQPNDGLAVVVVASSGAEVLNTPGEPRDASLEVVDGFGATVAVPMNPSFTMDPACMPPPPGPPELPMAGDQPEDPAAADAAVRAKFEAVFGPEDPASLETSVDDPTGLAEIRIQLQERYPKESADGSTTYEMDQLVFTNPGEAAFLFRPIVLGRELPWQIGGARVVDGDWKITRDTVCSMYRLGGPGCQPEGPVPMTATTAVAVPAPGG